MNGFLQWRGNKSSALEISPQEGRSPLGSDGPAFDNALPDPSSRTGERKRVDGRGRHVDMSPGQVVSASACVERGIALGAFGRGDKM